MGCDIHIHIEVKIKNVWHHYSNLCIARSYRLFGKLAGVRDLSEIPICSPRGIPKDLSEITRMDWENWKADAHNAGWITGDEMDQMDDWCCKELPDEYTYPPVFGFLFGSGFSKKSIESMKRYEQFKELEEVRLVFWFDN